jgi:hypothetical protein
VPSTRFFVQIALLSTITIGSTVGALASGGREYSGSTLWIRLPYDISLPNLRAFSVLEEPISSSGLGYYTGSGHELT